MSNNMLQTFFQNVSSAKALEHLLTIQYFISNGILINILALTLFSTVHEKSSLILNVFISKYPHSLLNM